MFKRIVKWCGYVFMVLFAVVIVGFIAITIVSGIRVNRLVERFEGTEIDDVMMITVEDYEVAYRAYGDPANRTLVFVHGFLGSSYDYRYLSKALEDDYYIIAIDLIGFGHSDKPSDFEYTTESHTHFLKKVVESLDLSNFTLFGHSMGGAIAIRYTYHYADDVNGLVLFASAGLALNQGSSLPLFFYDGLVKNYYLQYLGFRSVYYQQEYKHPDYFDPMFYFTHQIPSSTMRAFSEHIDNSTVEHLLPLIEQDTLIIHGTEDRWIPYHQSETMHSLLPNSELHLIDEIGHIPFIEGIEGTLEKTLPYLEK